MHLLQPTRKLFQIFDLTSRFQAGAMTSFHAEKCCHLMSGHAASAPRSCSSVHQFLIHSTFILVQLLCAFCFLVDPRLRFAHDLLLSGVFLTVFVHLFHHIHYFLQYCFTISFVSILACPLTAAFLFDERLKMYFHYGCALRCVALRGERNRNTIGVSISLATHCNAQP